MSKYGQFCPIALASEIVAERWTPLILRDLLHKSQRFADLQRGVPRMSRNLLAQRLVSLADAGLISKEAIPNGRGFMYSLTEAGAELEPVIESLGNWGYKWSIHNLQTKDLDPAHIMWALKRYIVMESLPEQRVVLLFKFPKPRPQRFWLVLSRPDPELCMSDPGYDIDLEVEVDALTLSNICLGKLPMTSAIRSGEMQVTGLPKLRQKITTWFGTTPFSKNG